MNSETVSTRRAVLLVAEREIRAKLRDRTFLIGTAIFLLIAFGSTVVPAMFDGGGPSRVAVADPAAVAPLRAAGLDVREVADPAAAEELVRDGEVAAAVLPGPQVVALEDAPDDVLDPLSAAPPVRLLSPDTVNPVAAILVPVLLAMIFFFTSLTFGLQIAQSVIEEKQTRIVEILVSAVPVRALLAGKVAAGALLAIGQLALIAVVALAGMRIADVDPGLLSLLTPVIGWFLPFFLVGFLMLAVMWAAAGALANRLEDLGGTSMPLQMAIMLPFFAVIFLNDNPVAMTILSYVPLSAPIAMPLRLFTDEAAGWEPFVSLGVLALAAVAFLLAGVRLYEGSLLRTNGRTKLATAWRTAPR